MPLKTARDVLIADPTVNSIVGERISPVQAQINEIFPRIVLTVMNAKPINTLGGFGGLNQCHVLVDAYAADYTGAKALADAARSALEAAGHLTVDQAGDKFDFDTDSSVFCVGYMFQIWK